MDLRGLDLRGFGRIVVCGALIACGGCDQGRKLESFGGPAMGSHYSVMYTRAAGQPDKDALRPEVETILAEIDHQMSLWHSDSELEQFNGLPANSCRTMPGAVLELVRVGQYLSRESDGAFDLTIEPVTQLWGIGPNAHSGQQPTTAQLAQTKATVGYRNLRIEGERLCKDAAVRVDLNSVAAGYAVERISQRMNALGLNDYLVQATGELKVKGRKPDGSPWRVTLEVPREDSGLFHKVFPLDGYSVSTSGDYRRYLSPGALAFSDTFDALTGMPVNNGLASVTVIHPSALMADGLSSLLLILGPERGWDYAQVHQLAAFFVLRADNGFIIRSNASFDRLAVEQPR